jgi:hypothetical protein
MSSHSEITALRARDTWLAIIAIASGFLFLAMWYLAPAVLEKPLWAGSALTVAFLLGTLSIVVPVLVAWLIAAADKAATAEETYETSDH